MTARLRAEETWKFPKIRGTILGVPIVRTIVFGSLYWGPPILGNYHLDTTSGLELQARKLWFSNAFEDERYYFPVGMDALDCECART